MQKLSGLQARYTRTPQKVAPPPGSLKEDESEPVSSALALVLRPSDQMGYFGAIHFPGYSRSTSKFLRLSPDADAGHVVQVMMDVWKLAAPTAVLSMTPESPSLDRRARGSPAGKGGCASGNREETGRESSNCRE